MIDLGKGRANAVGEPDNPTNSHIADHFVVSPDHTRLVGATAVGGRLNQYGFNVWVSDTRTWRVLGTAKIEAGVHSLANFDGGKLVAVGAGQGSVLVLDPATAAVRHRFQAYDRSKFGDFNINAIAGSPDGRLILVGVEGLTLNGAFYGTTDQ